MDKLAIEIEENNENGRNEGAHGTPNKSDKTVQVQSISDRALEKKSNVNRSYKNYLRIKNENMKKKNSKGSGSSRRSKGMSSDVSIGHIMLYEQI